MPCVPNRVRGSFKRRCAVLAVQLPLRRRDRKAQSANFSRPSKPRNGEMPRQKPEPWQPRERHRGWALPIPGRQQSLQSRTWGCSALQEPGARGCCSPPAGSNAVSPLPASLLASARCFRPELLLYSQVRKTAGFPPAGVQQVWAATCLGAGDRSEGNASVLGVAKFTGIKQVQEPELLVMASAEG